MVAWTKAVVVCWCVSMAQTSCGTGIPGWELVEGTPLHTLSCFPHGPLCQGELQEESPKWHDATLAVTRLFGLQLLAGIYETSSRNISIATRSCSLFHSCHQTQGCDLIQPASSTSNPRPNQPPAFSSTSSPAGSPDPDSLLISPHLSNLALFGIRP